VFEQFLSPSDAERVERTFEMLSQQATADWVLTGGLAVDLHLHSRSEQAVRDLNDIDFIVDRFCSIPETLASDLVFRHVHPADSMNKTLLQAVFPETAVRIDVFCASPAVMGRSIEIHFANSVHRIIALEDLTARFARLVLDLADDRAIPAKHARDFLRLLPLVATSRMETIWLDHRKPQHPISFRETSELLQKLNLTRRDLQIVPQYSHDCEVKCMRCIPTPAFPLATPQRIYSLLGYC
jgi:hypothetical protein